MNITFLTQAIDPASVLSVNENAVSVGIVVSTYDPGSNFGSNDFLYGEKKN